MTSTVQFLRVAGNREDAAGQPSRDPLVVGPSVLTVARSPIRIGPTVVVGPSDPILIEPQQMVVLLIEPSEAIVVGPSQALVIEAPPRAVWDERGWTVQQRGRELIYEGQYQIRSHATGEPLQYEGKISERGQQIAAYVADPPAELRRHPKAACFVLTRAPWFQVNWYRPARNVDDALLYVERVLDESVNGQR